MPNQEIVNRLGAHGQPIDFGERTVTTFVANAAIAAGQIVSLGSTLGQVGPSGGSGSLAVGVALESASSGERVRVVTHGFAQVTTGASYGLGANIVSNASGQAIGGGDWTASVRTMAVAAEASGGSGETRWVFVR